MKKNKILHTIIIVVAFLLIIISAVLLIGDFNVASKSIIVLVLIASISIHLGELLAKRKEKNK